MIEINIRPALPSDFVDIQSCAQSAYAKYVERMGREPAPMHADFATQIAHGWVVVAVCEAGLAGYIVFYFKNDHAHIENVAVSPEFSGHGIGKRLLEHAERAAQDVGCVAVELYTNEAMTENLAMYPKLGYIEVERRREDGFSRVFFRKQV
ncbi:GNAT family N-acetyltransferase [Salinispirillum sp. LH 10-3-1]|uniref:GNAT family N-acetyltransferase n=1 Tax=Salinispirillum sp. LH 10-3-1 TaxID=2952525 RepID=A0AB38YI36_9GAMM